MKGGLSPIRPPGPPPPEPVPAAPASAIRSGSLWLALHLPDLPLEALPREPGGPPRAITEGTGRRAVVVAADSLARARGVAPGTSAAGALALVPDLALEPRDPSREAAVLGSVAARAYRYTPRVCRGEGGAPVLEVGGSLSLFGGLEALRGELREELAALGLAARLGIAPTPLAAWLLARAGEEAPVTVPQHLPGRLGRLPLACLELSGEVREALEGLGVGRLGELWRLPRADLARRLGPQPGRLVDRALGRRPDPRPPWSLPAVFEGCLPLSWESGDRGCLGAGIRRLLGDLAGWLRARGMGVTGIEVHLAHRRGPATRFSLEVLAPTADADHLHRLVALRLERLALPQPVEQLGLRATRVLPLVPPRRDLFRRTPEPEEGLSGLVARLTARLGEAAVATPALVSDHRPERAWRWVRPGTTAAGAPPPASLPPRPLWLLESPRRLEADPAGPRHGGGGLRLLEGPERIESGWWDGGDVRRDYYRAVDGRGRRLWIYRDLRGEGRWFLHGLFG